MKLNERLRQLRAEKGWSLETAAIQTDTAKTQLIAYEARNRKKKNNPRYSTLCRIAAAYGLTPAGLLEGVEQYE